MRQSVEN